MKVHRGHGAQEETKSRCVPAKTAVYDFWCLLMFLVGFAYRLTCNTTHTFTTYLAPYILLRT